MYVVIRYVPALKQKVVPTGLALTICGKSSPGFIMALQAAPVPASVTVACEFPAVLLTVTLPLAAPAALGTKVACNVRLCPLFNVTGAVPPVTANGPETEIELTAIAADPLFEMRMFCPGLALLTGSVPKVKLAGEIVKLAGAAEATPVPVRVTAEGEFPAVLLTVRFPLAAPDALGLKITLNVTLSPGLNVVGNVLPADVNGPESVRAFTVIGPVLLLETVALCAALELLTVTLPKLSELVDKASTRSAVGCAAFVPVYPAQAESIAKRQHSITRQATTLNLIPPPRVRLF
jgi:hypothetical protein